MKFDWIEYFTIAQTLSSIAKEKSSPEAALRSSIGIKIDREHYF